MDDITVHLDLRAFYSSPVLPEILHDDTSWPDGGSRWGTALVRQVHLFNRCCRGLFNPVGCSLRCSGHEIFRRIFYVLPNGAGVGQSYIFCR